MKKNSSARRPADAWAQVRCRTNNISCLGLKTKILNRIYVRLRIFISTGSVSPKESCPFYILNANGTEDDFNLTTMDNPR